MKKITKNKALGQYFSGELVARILSALSDCQPGMSIIDPMAGIGDMFIPFDTNKYKCNAVEIDPTAYQELVTLIPSAICSNAFSIDACSTYKKRGYDLVITNPPYVRWQNLKDASLLPNYLSIQTIYQNLLHFTDVTLTLNQSERKIVRECLTSLSGLSDLAIPSWLLCMLLTCRTGVLAIVVPNSWMTREYAMPIIRLLKELFSIEVILNDINSVLFKGKALVRTSLIVARRRNEKTSTNNIIKFVSAYSSLFESDDCIPILKDCLHNNNNIKGVCEIKTAPQNELWNQNEAAYYTSFELSSLNNVLPLVTSKIVGVDYFGIEFYQGLRTGANTFFYVHRQGDTLIAADGHQMIYQHNKKLFKPTIQGQEDLSDSYSQGHVSNTYLLYLQNSVLSKDNNNSYGYNTVPNDVERYIIDSESRTVNDKTIPTLSAVRTNIRNDKTGLPPRYWYMLPVLSKRHIAPLFCPRLNSNRVWVRKNTYKQVIDANFVTILLSENSAITEKAALALLNSTWTALQFEENCTVMGGGALKVDSVQTNRFFFPKLNRNQLDALDKLGTQLLRSKLSDATIVNEIDKIILSDIEGIKIDKTILDLRALLTDYVNRRNGTR